MKVKMIIEERLVKEIELEIDTTDEKGAEDKAWQTIKDRIGNKELLLGVDDLAERIVETEINGHYYDWRELH